MMSFLLVVIERNADFLSLQSIIRCHRSDGDVGMCRVESSLLWLGQGRMRKGQRQHAS